MLKAYIDDSRMRHPPTFLDDKDVVALQAADLHAGWSRDQLDMLDRREVPEPLSASRNSGLALRSASWRKS